MSEFKTMNHGPGFFTAAEVAGWLSILKSAPYKLCNEGQIPATKIGRHWRFQISFLDEWLKTG